MEKFFIRIRGYIYDVNLTLEEAKSWYRFLQVTEPNITRRSRLINKHSKVI